MDAQVQRTIKQEKSISGVGLHTGKDVVMTLKPAPAGNGITFQRVDLPGEPVFKVGLPVVQESSRGTNLKIGENSIHTIEHFLAACSCAGVDNLLVAMDGPEPPAMDGSAKPFYEALLECGFTDQDIPRIIYRVTSACTVSDEHGSLSVTPCDSLKISYTLHYQSPRIGYQVKDITFNREEAAGELLPARTFCLHSEVEELKKLGLAQGGSLQNAVVIDNEKILNPEGLRFPDEMVRHKITDLIGDLAVAGLDIRGHFIAVKSGHKHNIRLLKELFNTNKIARLSTDEILDVQKICEIIPHRYPFLLVDRIIELDIGKTAVGIKNVTVNEPFFQGHFPSRPVMPGVLIMEALAQVAGACILSMPEHRGRVPFFTGLDRVKFRRPIVPGDQLRLEITVKKIKSVMGHVQSKALVNGKIAAEGILKFTVM